MKHSKKMVLVEYNKNNELKVEDKIPASAPDISKTDEIQQNLSLQIDEILNDRSLSDDEKYTLLTPLMHRYFKVTELIREERKDVLNQLNDLLKTQSVSSSSSAYPFHSTILNSNDRNSNSIITKPTQANLQGRQLIFETPSVTSKTKNSLNTSSFADNFTNKINLGNDIVARIEESGENNRSKAQSSGRKSSKSLSKIKKLSKSQSIDTTRGGAKIISWSKQKSK